MGAWFPMCRGAGSSSPGRPERAAVAELTWKGGLALLCCTRVTLSSGMLRVDTLELLETQRRKMTGNSSVSWKMIILRWSLAQLLALEDPRLAFVRY